MVIHRRESSGIEAQIRVQVCVFTALQADCINRNDQSFKNLPQLLRAVEDGGPEILRLFGRLVNESCYQDWDGLKKRG